MQHFDADFLGPAELFVADFATNTFGIATPQSQGPASDQPLALDTHAIDDWPCFGCNPPIQQPIDPRTGSEYILRLEKLLNGQINWSTTEFSARASNPTIYIEPVLANLQDKPMVISQVFFSRAREIHRAGIGEASLTRRKSSMTADFTGFFILPPAAVIEAFLGTYASRVETYMPFFPGAVISPTTLIASNDEKSSIILLLLMIALGAMGSSHPDSQYFASGLIEICRICIFDIMEKNVQLSAHPVML
jgi:hypothetical protein